MAVRFAGLFYLTPDPVLVTTIHCLSGHVCGSNSLSVHIDAAWQSHVTGNPGFVTNGTICGRTVRVFPYFAGGRFSWTLIRRLVHGLAVSHQASLAAARSCASIFVSVEHKERPRQ